MWDRLTNNLCFWHILHFLLICAQKPSLSGQWAPATATTDLGKFKNVWIVSEGLFERINKEHKW